MSEPGTVVDVVVVASDDVVVDPGPSRILGSNVVSDAGAPATRKTGSCVSTSVSTNSGTSDPGDTVMVRSRSKSGQSPSGALTFTSDASGRAGLSGLPHLQRTTGAPNLSTSTAVPACRIESIALATPFLKPWLMARRSAWSTTSVRLETYGPIWSTSMPMTSAQALALSALSSRNCTSCFESHTDSRLVPP